MKNYINILGHKIELTAEQVEQLRGVLPSGNVRLTDITVGENFKVGSHEFVVLEHSGDTTAAIRTELLIERTEFGTTNQFDGSYVDEACSKFADEIAAIVGAENLVEHTVDLTSDDGLKDYGKVRRRVSLLTADLYRRYVDVLDLHKPDKWWWLATPFSTKRHENDAWVKCVAPSGYFDYVRYSNDYGARPFYIFKSDIFVSQ